MRSDPAAGPHRGRRLAEVVAERAEHQHEALAATVVRGCCRRCRFRMTLTGVAVVVLGYRCSHRADNTIRAALPAAVAVRVRHRRPGCATRLANVLAGAAQGGGHVQDHEGVHPYVALRMPFGVLGDTAQGVELGEEAEQVRVFQELEAERRLRCAKQQLPELLEHPARRTARSGPAPGRARSAHRPGSYRAGPRAGPTRRPRNGSSGKCAGSVARSMRRSRSLRPPWGSSTSAVSGSIPMLFTVRSRRRAACAKSSDGSGATSKPRCPGPHLLSRRGREKSTSISPTRNTPKARPTACTLPKPARRVSSRAQRRGPNTSTSTSLERTPRRVVAHPAAHDNGPSARVTDGGRDLVDRRCEFQAGGGHRSFGSLGAQWSGTEVRPFQ